MSDSNPTLIENYKYLSRYVPKDLKFILGIINMGGGSLDIGGLNGDTGFRRVQKLKELILKQAQEKNVSNQINMKEITLEDNLLRLSIHISSAESLILSKNQTPLLLASQVLFKSPAEAQKFKTWKQSLTCSIKGADLWSEFQAHQLDSSIQFNQSKRKLILQKSDDGSHTLFIPEMNETYHSTKGSRTEAEYVFLEKGIDFTTAFKQKNQLKILEIGFGTGLNAWLSQKKSQSHNLIIDYQTLEPFPIPVETLEHLDFGFESQEENKNWAELHDLPWRVSTKTSSTFRFQKFQEKLEDFETDERFDLIFFDAFAPSKQPELWSLEVFQKCIKLLEPMGCLVSYCASSIFKKNLLLAGFKIETLEGPPGKREMVRAIKS